MEISVYSIQKNSDEFASEIAKYIAMSKNFATIKDSVLFNNKIAKAQSTSRNEALMAYDEIYSDKINGFCVGLDENGAMLDSLEFAKLISNRNKISFFIGGAYGFSENFKNKMDKLISFSKFTIAHKIVKLMLYEQIYRGLSINANHPYHK